MRAPVLVLLVGCATASPPVASTPSNHTPTEATPPDLATLRTMLAGNAGKLDKHPGCDDGELGDYVTLLVTNGSPAPDGEIHRLSGGCGTFPTSPLPIDPPADAAYWFCTVDSYTADPQLGSPWHYALHLRMRKSDRLVDLATVACPGA